MKKRIIIYLFLFFLLLIGIYFYSTLGGFNKPEITLKEVPQYWVAGKAYKGKMTEKTFGNLFDEAEDEIRKGTSGQVCGIFYNTPQNKNDTIDAFIGILLPDSSSAFPPSYSLRSVPARRVVQAHIKAHFLTMPPDIYGDIKNFARKNNIELSEVPALEIYPGEREIIIQVP